MNRQIALILLLGVLATSGCKVFKKASRRNVSVVDTAAVTRTPDNNETPAKPAIDPAKQAIITSLTLLWNRQFAFNTFSGKAKMHYEGTGMKQEFTTHFRIKRNEAIWASVTAVGGVVQVARILITQDSFKLINYLQNNYMAMSLSEASKVLPVPANFSMLQNLIIGDVVNKDGTLTDGVDAGGTLSLTAQDGSLTQVAKWNKADSTLRLVQITNTGSQPLDATLQYGDYKKEDGRLFADTRTINIINSGQQYYLDMNFGNVKFDQPTDLPFTIPKNFERK